LAIFRLEPGGGREQQCLAVASELAGLGHAVTLYSTTAPSRHPAGVDFVAVARRGRTNHGRLAAFAADAATAMRGRCDRAVAFHLVPGFDAIFCCDPLRRIPWWGGLLPRYRTYAALESAALKAPSRTRVMALTAGQLAAFEARGLVPDRGYLLPPAVDRARVDPALAEMGARPAPADAAGPVWLWIAAQPHTKGLDRVVRSLAKVGEARLIVAGLSRSDQKAAPFVALADKLGVASRIDWRGFLSNDALKAAMAQSSLLVHPARADLTGNVILEALGNGLPAVVSAACGFAEHVERAGAGVVLAAPFVQADLDRALTEADPATRSAWSAKALSYVRAGDIFSGLSRAADLIETTF